MADELDVLLEKVGDVALRADLRSAIDRIRAKRSFGLVFESHIPERVRLPDHPLRRGVKVVGRDAGGDSRLVSRVRDGLATLVGSDGSTEEVKITDLVVVAEFGQAIYPGFIRLGSIDCGGDRPAHVVINGENYHALEALQFTHAGKVDCIYIDPPYNSGGTRDWKYDNNYVDTDDAYRHSKWLAFMERRLKLAKQLLNPDDSVLIVTIDEKERNRLGMLLEQTFSGVHTQMVTTVINPKGASLGRDFARVDEHLFVLFLGAASLVPEVRDMLDEKKNRAASTSVKWSSLIRGGAKGIRTDSPGNYYPVFIDVKTEVIHSFGSALPWDKMKSEIKPPPGTVAVWPPDHPSGVEGRWGIGRETAAQLYEIGALRLGELDFEAGSFPMSYLSSGIMEKIKLGEIRTLGHRPDGSLIVRYPENTKVTQPKTVWKMKPHNAGEYGSKLISTLLPGRKFPFPKSLYAVEDALRFFLAQKPKAVVLDFFAGSGTTTHAVMRLNRQDGGVRQSIAVTNNEVSAEEAEHLRAGGHLVGEAEWEALGVFEHITRPRITAAVTGVSPNGNPVEGDYKFVDEFPMAEGFEENVEFLKLVYLDPVDVELGSAFAAVAPLLWLRAGGSGPMIEECLDATGHRKPHMFTEHYGVLFDADTWRAFVEVLPSSARTVFVVTDSDSTFAGIAEALPARVEPVRLYENYLTTFAINRGP